MNINITHEIKTICPTLTLGIIECQITNTAFDKELWDHIESASQALKENYKIPDIKNIPIIKATRDVYKKCGKDPNRYRPSSESLCRRILSGKELYQITTGVDLINLISFKTGYAIGAFDANKISGDLSYGIGEENENYHGIGRGQLNIAGLPILRDELGGIGTPTSDEERTKLNLESSSLLININGYLGQKLLTPVVEETISLLTKYLNANTINARYIA